MKRLTYILLLATVAILGSCSKEDDIQDPTAGYFTQMATAGYSNLDTITPPLNPLMPGTMDSDSVAIPTYLGYLDLAKYSDGTRYCALIGLNKYTDSDSTTVYSRFGYSGRVYFLLDEHNLPIRCDNEIVSGLKIGEVIYVTGELMQSIQKSDVLGISVMQITSSGDYAGVDQINYGDCIKITNANLHVTYTRKEVTE